MKTVKLSPSELFNTLGVKDNEEARKVFEATLSFLLYIEVGDVIKLPTATIKKISHDKLAINQTVVNDSNLLKLLKNKIIEVDI